MELRETERTLQGRLLLPGEASGPVLKLAAPISFWGGVDPETGSISDPRHPNHGMCIRGRVLVVPVTVGSSSSSAVMLELLRNGKAPTALLLGNTDAILLLGVVVARELGYPTVPVVQLPSTQLAVMTDDVEVRITSDGRVVWAA
jgi:predicted aconitase with swiveling domain